MGGDVLSQSEVENLLSAMATGGQDVQPAAAAAPRGPAQDQGASTGSGR